MSFPRGYYNDIIIIISLFRVHGRPIVVFTILFTFHVFFPVDAGGVGHVKTHWSANFKMYQDAGKNNVTLIYSFPLLRTNVYRYVRQSGSRRFYLNHTKCVCDKSCKIYKIVCRKWINRIKVRFIRYTTTVLNWEEIITH